MKTLLVTGTDTAVGKTWITCLLIRHLVEKGIQAGGYKPVCSGSEQNERGQPVWNDVDRIRAACPRNPSARQICPQTFHAPLAPPLAAAQQGLVVDQQLLIHGLDAWRGTCSHLVVEGAGGLLCPVSSTWTVADLALQWNSPLIVVAANRLGVVNHTLLTVRLAQHLGLHVAAVVLNSPVASLPDSQALGSAPSPPCELSRGNILLLKEWLPAVPLFACGFGQQELVPLCGQARALQWTEVFADSPARHLA